MNQAFNMPESKKLGSEFDEKVRKQKLVEEADCKNIGDVFSGLIEKDKEMKGGLKQELIVEADFIELS